MEAIIQRAIEESNKVSITEVIKSINSSIIGGVKGFMARNKVHGGFDITVRNKLHFSQDFGFSHNVTGVVRSGNNEREFICNHKELISEHNPLFMLRGIMMAQSFKVNASRIDVGLAEDSKSESIRFIKNYIAETMKDTHAIVSIDRDSSGKFAIEVELIDIKEEGLSRHSPRPSMLKVRN